MNNESKKRQQWNSKLGFIFAAVGSAVGLGNIWRYPYVLYKNGGGAFLIPYFIAIFTAGIPLLILEYVLGTKFRGTSPLALARVKKNYEWIGWLPAFIAGFILLYYSVILSWAMNFAVLSFTKAWGNSPNDFFFGEFLKVSDSPMQLGGINIAVFLGLVLLWCCSYFLCSKNIDKGIETASKILIPLMFGIIVIIIIRGVTLPNAVLGLNELFTPDWSKVMDANVWLAAYGQVFFSMSLAMGIMITYSSYLPKDTEIVNTAFIAGLSNSAFEFTAAIGVFGILGYMSSIEGVPLDEVAKSGIGLAFIVFPEGINAMGNLGYFIGILFFACLIFAGFTSFISLLEAFSAPFAEKLGISRKKIFAVTCCIGLACSTLFATGAGVYILDIVDYALNNFGLVSVGILEVVAIGWFMKISKYRDAANKNSYFKVGKWWEICIKFIIPAVLFVTLIKTLFDILTKGYEGYPAISLVLYGGGVIILCFVFSFMFSKKEWATDIKLELEDGLKDDDL